MIEKELQNIEIDMLPLLTKGRDELYLQNMKALMEWRPKKNHLIFRLWEWIHG
jgi:hypothetical protein